MNGASFDVYLTGASDPSPSGQMRIAATISARYRLPAPRIAEVLAEGGTCRVGEGLSGADAQALVDALAALGATARQVPAGAAPGAPPAVVAVPVVTPVAVASVPPRAPVRSTRAEPDVLDIEVPVGDTVRCPIHGLAYDRSRGSGCVRCMAPARAQARRLEDESGATGSRRLADSPVRRAFMGLALALLLGFVPTAYYARAANRGQLDALRAEQAGLSSKPATPDTLSRFDELDAQVQAAHRRGAGKALLIWIVVGGLTAAAWARLTVPREVD
jgi:hypothetical protein